MKHFQRRGIATIPTKKSSPGGSKSVIQITVPRLKWDFRAFFLDMPLELPHNLSQRCAERPVATSNR